MHIFRAEWPRWKRWVQRRKEEAIMIILQSLSVFTMSLMLLSIVYCFFFKYVSIGNMLSLKSFFVSFFLTPIPLKIFKQASHFTMLRVVLFVVFLIPGILQTGRSGHVESGASFVEDVRAIPFQRKKILWNQKFPSLYYLFEDPDYHAFAYDANRYPEYTVIFIVVILIVSFCIPIKSAATRNGRTMTKSQQHDFRSQYQLRY